MAKVPDKTGQFTDKNYWDTFFKKRKEAFEWYGSYDDLAIVFERYLKPKDSILQIGCGNSTLADSLYDNGFQKVTSIDTAADAINKQVSRNANKRPDLIFETMDATQLTYSDTNFQVVLDKGTLDALLPDEEGMPDYLPVAFKMVQEVHRVLSSSGGRYLIVTLAQKHVLKFWIESFQNRGYIMRVHQLDVDNGERDPTFFKYPVFLFIATKLKIQIIGNQVLEFCYGAEKKAVRFDSIQGIVEKVEAGQEFSRFCHMCRTSKLDEVTKICMRDINGNPRFNINLVDKTIRIHNSYAVFIVPQGRESEWLFQHPSGMRDLCNRTNASRLAIVSLCRDQVYPHIESIKAELNSFVAKFAPIEAADIRMDFLSIADGVGVREVVVRGASELNGEYIVEDVTVTEEGEVSILRRLIFTKSPTLIQSEARVVVKGKTSSGNPKKVIDEWTLCCDHHRSMVPAVAFVCPTHPKDYAYNIAVIGLGGGSLTAYLHKLLPKAYIEGVELDPVVLSIAQSFFGLKQGERLKCLVMDGLDFIQDAASKNRKFDVLFLDVAGSEQIDGLSCPPPQFITEAMLSLMWQILQPNGWLALNVVTRDQALSDRVELDVKKYFPNILKHKGEHDVNTILLCHPTTPQNAKLFQEQLNSRHKVFLEYSRKRTDENEKQLKRNMKNLKL